MKSIVAAAAAIITVACAALAIATPGDAATPRSFDDVTATDAAPAVEYIAFEPMEIVARPAGIVMEPLVITVDAPVVAGDEIVMEPLVITVDAPAIASETIVMEPMHIVAGQADFTPVAAL